MPINRPVLRRRSIANELDVVQGFQFFARFVPVEISGALHAFYYMFVVDIEFLLLLLPETGAKFERFVVAIFASFVVVVNLMIDCVRGRNEEDGNC